MAGGALTDDIFVYTKTAVNIEFDPAKDATNIAKHGISLSRGGELDPIDYVDDSHLYDEPRYRLVGYIDGMLHVLAAVDRGDVMRVISLRPATRQEVKRYARQ
jgi:uncharacterized DUF497 family protein